ncbi:MerR HTH family regulatory protein [Desulfitobacterium hafniense]|uniref:MerR HTH family regulatory protein n=1 Tax=Desulfitobacterium hafniense TaxID=49338 RepID=A0A098AW74_DESHA|nr:MerR family transcriptional regulator [Desulfitobacterium hafniense]CDX00838.1 MerR HTH family regulatory protein [Desulfitobacterium hafniense]
MPAMDSLQYSGISTCNFRISALQHSVLLSYNKHIAKRLGVQYHVINHYAVKLEDLLGTDMLVDPRNGYRKFTAKGLRMMKIIRKMVQDEKKTLKQVREELSKDLQENLSKRIEIEIAESNAKITQDLEIVKRQTSEMYNALVSLVSKIEVLVLLPDELMAYQEESKQIIVQQQQVIDQLIKKLAASRNDEEQLRKDISELKKELDALRTYCKLLNGDTEHTLSDREKIWNPLATRKKVKKIWRPLKKWYFKSQK